MKQIVDGRRKSKKKYRVRSRRKDQGEFLHIKMATGHVGFGCHFFVWGKRRFYWCLFAQEFFADLVDIAGARESP